MNFKLDNYTAVGIAEGFIKAETDEQIIQAWQYLVDTGLAWNLQGWFGRTARRLIDDGFINQSIQESNFIDDEEKMIDFNTLTKEQFLNSYSYITEQEYDNTLKQLEATQ
jgi:hypothetical protein